MPSYQYSYSIIIPHKNIPDLLQRCLNSIPQRDDVQVIVVDDNSSPDIVDFRNFPGLNQPNVEVYFDKSGKGAGRARNIGMEYAKGKWILFADADDFFSDNFNDILNQHKECSEDVVYYDFKSVDNEDITKECETNPEKYIRNFIPFTDERIRHIHLVPWAKIIRKQLIDKIQCKFDEVRWGNDTYCMMLIGVNAKTIRITTTILYIQTKRKNSLTSESCATKAELECRISGILKATNIAILHGYKDAAKLSDYYIQTIYQRNYKILFMRCVKNMNDIGIKRVIELLTEGSNLKGKMYVYMLVAVGRIIPLKPLY